MPTFSVGGRPAGPIFEEGVVFGTPTEAGDGKFTAELEIAPLIDVRRRATSPSSRRGRSPGWARRPTSTPQVRPAPRLRPTPLVHHVEEVGLAAVAIVALIGVPIGVVPGSGARSGCAGSGPGSSLPTSSPSR